MYTVYQHRNKINGKVYIGITMQTPEQRWRHGEGYKSSPHFYAAIQNMVGIILNIISYFKI